MQLESLVVTTKNTLWKMLLILAFHLVEQKFSRKPILGKWELIIEIRVGKIEFLATGGKWLSFYVKAYNKSLKHRAFGAGQLLSRSFVVLLRKSIPQNRNLITAA